MRSESYAVALLASVALLLPAAAGAQTARNGNIYNGTAHEPAAGPVHGNESAAGVAQPQGQAEHQTNEVESLDKQLTEKADHDPAKNTPTPQPPNASGR